MKTQFASFYYYTAADQKKLISEREGEQRLGQEVLFRESENSEWKSRRFHILGIAEDIGPQLNKGFGGSKRAFEVFLPRFLAVQSNLFINGKECCIHGYITVDSTEIHQEAILELDQLIEDWAAEVILSKGVPIVIGGGHNNALGLINGAARALQTPVSVSNLDPHADVRPTGERHSGNSFSTAHEKGTLLKYAVMGLHENYNNQFILNKLNEMGAWRYYFEQWIDHPGQFRRDLESVEHVMRNDYLGIELDMDSIAYMPSSAFTPSGVTVEQARCYIRRMAQAEKVVYLHLPEAAPATEQEDKVVGKTLSYLVTDFIKIRSNI